MRAVVVAIGLCSMAAAQGPAANPKTEPTKRAMVIGNGGYQFLPATACPLANAEAFANALAPLGFAVTARYDLPDKKFLAEMQEFVGSIQASDIVLFYFSGYGLQADDVNWLLPVNFNPDDGLPVNQKAYSLRRLIADVERKGAGPRIVIIDASRQNPKLAPEGLAPVQNVPSGTLLSFSADANQSTPPDAAGKQVQPYTAALIRAIEKPGSTPLTAFNDVQAEVNRATGGKQLPFVFAVAMQDFYFVPPPPPPTPKPVVITAKETRKENPKDLLMYVWIPSGTFLMGCVKGDRKCAADENPQHEVKISAGFWMTRTEVTVNAYQRFTDATGHRTPPKTKTNPKWQGTDLPVAMVSWEDASEYCKWVGGRLPSEAEWEYGARGGKADEIYPWGNTFDPKLANSYKTDPKLKGGRPETAPVRKLGNGNGFDLWDMVGNVREWVLDVYDPTAYKRTAPAVDPIVGTGSNQRVIRGGSYNGGPDDLRISGRDHADPVKEVTNQTGFRCVVREMH